MIRSELDKGGTMALYMELDSRLRTFKRRSISYIIHAHGPNVADVMLTVNGKKGSAQKSLVIIRDEVLDIWFVYSEGYQYELGNSISGVSTLLRKMVQRLAVIVNKI